MDYKALCEATIEIATEAGVYIHGRTKKHFPEVKLKLKECTIL